MGVVYRKKKVAPTQQVYLTPENIKSRYTDWFDLAPYPKPDWDGLEVSWGVHAFCNPPWGNIRPWVEQALLERERLCSTHASPTGDQHCHVARSYIPASDMDHLS